MCSTMVGGGWWRLAVGGWRLAVGNWRLVAVGGGWRRLVVGDWWLVAVGSGWQLAVGRRWRLAAVGGWRLVAVGGWRLVAVGGWRELAVGGWWSLGAVLSKKREKKIWSLKDRPGQAPPSWALPHKTRGVCASPFEDHPPVRPCPEHFGAVARGLSHHRPPNAHRPPQDTKGGGGGATGAATPLRVHPPLPCAGLGHHRRVQAPPAGEGGGGGAHVPNDIHMAHDDGVLVLQRRLRRSGGRRFVLRKEAKAEYVRCTPGVRCCGGGGGCLRKADGVPYSTPGVRCCGGVFRNGSWACVRAPAECCTSGLPRRNSEPWVVCTCGKQHKSAERKWARQRPTRPEEPFGHRR